MGEHKIALVENARTKRITCALCLTTTAVELEHWKDDPPTDFDHDCKAKGPRLSHPVTRDGMPLPMFPTGERVVVQRLPSEAKIGGLHIPETSQAPCQYATLLAAGPQAMGILDDMGITIGDTVCFAKYSGIGWEWQPVGTTAIGDRRTVDLINVKDIQGGQELSAKMLDGRLGISLYCRDCGHPVDKFHAPEKGSELEYRMFEEQPK